MAVQCDNRKMEKDPILVLPIPRCGLLTSVICLSTTAFISYCLSLRGEFVFDDSEAIVRNRDISLMVPISELFQHDFWGQNISFTTSHKSYRPLTVLAFRLIRAVSNELSPYPFHLANVLLHAVVSLLAFASYKAVCGLYEDVAFLSGLMFAVHPVHTECVAGIVGLAELLCAFFAFLGFLLYVYGCRSPRILKNFVCASGSTLLCIIAMLCKEQGIAMLGVCSIYDITQVLLSIDEWRSPQYRDVVNNSYRRIICYIKGWLVLVSSLIKNRLFLYRQLVLYMGAIMALYCRLKIMEFSPPIFQPMDNPTAFKNDLITRVINYNYLYAVNALLLIWPKWLCFDWSMGCIPLIDPYRYPPDVRMLAPVSLWAVLGMLCIKIFNSEIYSKRIRTIGLACTIVLFIPSSNILFTVGFVIAERVLYLPSFGFCLLAAAEMRNLSLLPHFRKLIQLLIPLIIVSFIARSIERTLQWTDEKTLFESALSVCPLNAKVHYNVAKNAADSGDTDRAIAFYYEALKLNPQYDQAMNNLANILRQRGNLKEAETLLMRAVQIRPDFAAAWMNLGIVYSNLKYYSQSEECYKTALKFRRNYPDCYYNLGNLYLQQKRYREAQQVWYKALNLKPTHSLCWSNLVVMLDTLGNYELAEEAALEAVIHLPEDAAAHFNLANVLGKLNKFEESESHFLKALSLNPSNALYYSNLGVLYHRWKKLCKAKTFYEKALSLKHDLTSTRKNLEDVEKLVGVTSCADSD